MENRIGLGLEAPHIRELRIDPKSFIPVQQEGAPKIQEEQFTPTQVRLAKILSDAWTQQKDSSEFLPVEQRPVDLGEVEGLHVIDSANRQVEFEGKHFTLPEEWSVNQKTNTISVLPGETHAGKQIIGASPKTLSLLASTTQNVKPGPAATPKTGTHFSDAPVEHAKAKPLTEAQIEEQQAQTLRNQQAIAAAAARKAETKSIVQNNKPAQRGAENSRPIVPEAQNFKSSIEAAASLISADASMKQAISGAINTQAKTETSKQQETTAAVQHSAEQNVGNIVAAKGAADEANQQNQQGRQEAAFQQEEVHAQQSVGSAKAGQGVPGKSKK